MYLLPEWREARDWVGFTRVLEGRLAQGFFSKTTPSSCLHIEEYNHSSGVWSKRTHLNLRIRTQAVLNIKTHI